MVAAHLPLLAASVLSVLFDTRPDPLGPAATAALAVGAGALVLALHVRHALAFAAGVVPRAWPITLAALTTLVYVPLGWLPGGWLVIQWALAASLVMLLPRRMGAALAALLVLGSEIVLSGHVIRTAGLPPAVAGWSAVYNMVVAVLGPVALLAVIRLVRVLDELSAARAQLAQTATQRERLRISRDLHDLLGQSLTAMSLKGDLALRLVNGDRPAAIAELEGLVGIGRAALRDVRTVAFDRHPTSFDDELAAARQLLHAAGIVARIETAPFSDAMSAAEDQALGWLLREGVTNVLRHSEATHVVIRAERCPGQRRLEIVNDGTGSAPGPGATGSGLDGLRDRIAPLGGTLTAGALDGETFRLAVDLPEEPM
ncbi:sensor histidine kinase [Blastococcus aurantiacus]|nr:histidine kinase [Blastococcus aurantiacus]